MFRAGIALLLGLSLGVDRARAQTAGGAPLPAGAEITAEQIQSLISQLDNLGEEGAKIKAEATALYQQAIKDLNQAKKFTGDAEAYRKRLEELPAELKAERERPTRTFPPAETFQNVPVERLQEELHEVQAQLDFVRKELARLREEPSRREARRAEIAKRLTELANELEGLAAREGGAAPDGEPPPVTLAKQSAATARRRALSAEKGALEAEQRYYAAASEIIPLQAQNYASEARRLERREELLQTAVSDRQLAEATRLTHEAQLAVETATMSNPHLVALARSNAELAAENLQLHRDLAFAREQLKQALSAHDDLRADLVNTRATIGQQIDSLRRLSQVSGQLLRQKRAGLPSVATYLRSIQTRESLRADRQFKQYTWGEELKRLSAAAESGAAARGSESDSPDSDAAQAYRQFLENSRADILARLIATHRSFNQTLLELNTAESQIIQTTREYEEYISARILWIQSATPLTWAYLRPGRDAAWWLIRPDNWLSVGRLLLRDLTENPFWFPLFIAAFVPLLYYQRRFRQGITHLGESARRRGFCRFGPTLETLLLTALISIPWPALLGYLSWRLFAQLVESEFATALAAGTKAMALSFLGLEFVRQSCRNAGLAEAHFGWPREAVQLLRKHLRWYIPLGLPLVMIAVMFFSQKEEQWNNSIGRAAFLILMVLSFALLRRVLRPAGGVFTVFLVYQQDSWTFRLRHVWYTILVAVPIALAILAFIGYYYTAMQLAGRCAATACLLVGLLFVAGLLLRWVMMNRRRLAMHQARQRLAEAAAPSEEGSAPAEDAQLDLGAISDQTRQLLKTIVILAGLFGIWLIWEEVFPALTQLESIPLLGMPGTLNVAQAVILLLVMVVTAVLAKNLPGLLELTILKNLPLDAGARYAATTVAQYTIVLIGLVVGCQVLNIQWQNVQWLVAALGVGLGFGLQEILANFVSGLILLFERPIRVNDIVTIGETTGLVSRIRIRATTITDWDRKEYLVPNKDIVTGRVLNWTLSDQVNRIVITVGLSYGSDTERARALLLDVARGHPSVLKDPAASATFEGFEESTLKMSLRCFLPTFENRLGVIHELHTAIHKRFAEERIEIAFPQRDIHIRSIPDSWLAACGAGDPGRKASTTLD